MIASTFSPERSALRGIGSSAVVADHAIQLLPPILSASGLGASIWVADDVSQIGWMGVALFLTLSIYLLMGSLDYNSDLKRYFLRRIKRIWPLYFGMCAALFILFDRDLTHLWWNLTFMAVLNPSEMFTNTQTGWPITYVVWTLQVEELAYLFFPVIAWLGHRYRMLIGWGLIWTTIVVWAFYGNLDYFTPWPWLCCYGFGLLAYERGAWFQRAGRWLLIPAILPFVPSALNWVLPFALPQVGWPIGLFLIGPAVAWVIAYPPAFLRKAALVAVGECSYALYLVHLLILDYLGLIGVPIAYATAWWLESIQRGKEMRRRVRQTEGRALSV